jgi:hypothetical protein
LHGLRRQLHRAVFSLRADASYCVARVTPPG